MREPHGPHPVDISWIGWEAGVPLLPLEELIVIAFLAAFLVLVLGAIFVLIEFKKTKTGLSHQQIYDIVSTGLIAQGAKSLLNDDGLSCRYRGTYGRKCAIGFLIPDSMYNPKMEATYFTDDLIKPVLENVLNRKMTLMDQALLDDLLHVHDHDDPAFWPHKLTAVAIRHGLRA